MKSQISNLDPQNPSRQSGFSHRQAVQQLRNQIQRGFTFMELLIVMVIIAILVAVAIPKYLAHLRHAKEVVLQQNLWSMRRAIDFYTTDKEKPPTSLQDLVSGGYLRDVPKDPLCLDCGWEEIPATATESLDAQGGIGDVKSRAPGTDQNGKAYSEY